MPGPVLIGPLLEFIILALLIRVLLRARRHAMRLNLNP
jgi:hypothetical protein